MFSVLVLEYDVQVNGRMLEPQSGSKINSIKSEKDTK